MGSKYEETGRGRKIMAVGFRHQSWRSERWLQLFGTELDCSVSSVKRTVTCTVMRACSSIIVVSKREVMLSVHEAAVSIVSFGRIGTSRAAVADYA